MAMRCGSCSVIQLAAVLGFAGLGVGGYSYFSDCGSCDGTATNASLVSTETECGGCCPGEKAEAVQLVKAEGSCCAESAEAGAAVILASETKTEVKAEGSCCTGEAKVACKNGTEGCTGDGKDGCCGGCADEKKAAETVASSGAAPTGGKN